MTYGLRRINPWLHKFFVCWVCVCVLFTCLAPKKADANPAVLAPLLAPEILVVGSIAVAGGIIFAAATDQDIKAVLADMYSKGKTLFDSAIASISNGTVHITSELADFVQNYTLNDATRLTGETINLGEVLADWTVVGNVGYTTDTTKSTYSIPISDGAIRGTLQKDTTTNLANTITIIDNLNKLYSVGMTKELMGLQQPGNVPVFQTKYTMSTSTGIASWYSGTSLISSEWNTQQSLQPFLVELNSADITVRMQIGGNDFTFPLLSGSTSFIRSDMGQWNGSVQNNKINGLEYQLGESVLTPSETVIVGDIPIDIPWAKDIDLTNKDIALPIPIEGVTVTTATGAIADVTADTLTITDTVTGAPITPPVPPDLPKVPWYAFFSYFLDLLRAMLQYVLRLVAFLVTLQGVSPKSMGEYDGVFTWFRNMSWGGINVYTTVVSLAGIAISLMIYKVVRRV